MVITLGADESFGLAIQVIKVGEIYLKSQLAVFACHQGLIDNVSASRKA